MGTTSFPEPGAVTFHLTAWMPLAYKGYGFRSRLTWQCQRSNDVRTN
jgi:hypothetical protein